jgi:hypothetical protein
MWLLTMSLHDRKELDERLGAGPEDNLAFALCLCIIEILESVAQNTGACHGGRWAGSLGLRIASAKGTCRANVSPFMSACALQVRDCV